jgi:aspartate-semialdehyde dehydrogenase
MPDYAKDMIVVPATVESAQAKIVFSALHNEIAKDLEPQFARAGMAVCSNASSYRRDDDVPLLLPEINADHIHLVTQQRKNKNYSGCIITNPNCTSTGLTIALKALDDAFGVKKVFAVSLQALSGAGYPGVALARHRGQCDSQHQRRRGKSGMGAAQDAWQIQQRQN